MRTRIKISKINKKIKMQSLYHKWSGLPCGGCEEIYESNEKMVAIKREIIVVKRKLTKISG